MVFIPLVGHLKAWPAVAEYVSPSPYSGSLCPLNRISGMCLRWLGKKSSIHAEKKQSSFAVWHPNQIRMIVDFLAYRPFRHALSITQVGRLKETYPLLEALWKI